MYKEVGVHMNKIRIRNQKEWNENKDSSLLQEWEEVVSNILLTTPGKKMLIPGECFVCKERVDFILDNKWSDC